MRAIQTLEETYKYISQFKHFHSFSRREIAMEDVISVTSSLEAITFSSYNKFRPTQNCKDIMSENRERIISLLK